MTITYRDTKGGDLTPEEVDANFRHVLESSNQTFTPSGSGAVTEDVQAALRRTVFASQYTSVQAAINAGANKTLIFEGTYTLAAGVTWASNVNAHFRNAVFVYDGDDATDVITLSSVDNVHWTGKLTVKSNDPSATNEVYGIFANGLTNFSAEHLHFEDMARGFEAANMDFFTIGQLSGKDLYGTLQSGADNVGSIITFNDCSRGQVGRALGENIGKSAVYFAVSSDGGNADNEDITIGEINVDLDDTKANGSALAVRSAINCSVGQVVANGGYRAVSIGAENGDTAYNIDHFTIGSVVGRDHVASGNDAKGVHIFSAEATKRVKNISIDSIDIDGAQTGLCDFGECDGLRIGTVVGKNTSGAGDGFTMDDCTDVHIGVLDIQGVADGDLIQITNTDDWHIDRVLGKDSNTSGDVGVRLTGNEYFTIGSIHVEDIAADGVYFTGTNLDGWIGKVIGKDICRVDSGRDIFRADNTNLRCRVESVSGITTTGNKFARVVDIGSVGSYCCSVGDTNAVGCTNAETVITAGFAAVRIKGGVLYDAAAPSTGTWEDGEAVNNSAAAASGTPGWVCTTPGTFSTATDNTGDTDGSTGVITGVTDTSDFIEGQLLTVSAGFASTGPFRLLSKTATSLTLDAVSNGAQSNVTVDTADPVFGIRAVMS